MKAKKITMRMLDHAMDKCPRACCGELVRLRKDKMRLDWLIRNISEPGFEILDISRRLIDAAIRASKKGRGEKP